MERPLRFTVANKHDASSHVVSAATTVAIEVGAIFGLVAALNQGALIRQLQVIQAAIDAPREIPKAPPPPPPLLAKPIPPVAIMPEFAVQNPAPLSITTVPKQNVATPPPVQAPIGHAAASDPLRPIARTHTLPPYPPIARRLNEQGTTLMEITITTQGNVNECNIAQGSGSERLDQAACDFVKQNWRWQPPTKAGTPVSAKTRVSVKWTLQEAK
jgi:protein TonB